MQITIAVSDVRKAGACTTKPFEAVYGDSVVLDWTLETQLEFIRGPLRQYFGWAITAGLVPMWSMREADLSRANLWGANLRGANLWGANLVEANLRGAILPEDYRQKEGTK